MRSMGSPDLIADRRWRVLALLGQGHSLTAVARKICCARISVLRWRDLMNEKDNDVFNVLLPRGRPSRLNAIQIRKLEWILLKGRLACGYQSYLWSSQQIGDVIKREFGVSYHRDNIGRVRIVLWLAVTRLGAGVQELCAGTKVHHMPVLTYSRGSSYCTAAL